MKEMSFSAIHYELNNYVEMWMPLITEIMLCKYINSFPILVQLAADDVTF